MNKVERQFFDAFNNYFCHDDAPFKLEPQKPIGIYVPDFVYGDFIIEIDGHDFHKTKEQREKDYSKERYFMARGFVVIRFMATEVFLNAQECINQLNSITSVISDKLVNAYEAGYTAGKRQQHTVEDNGSLSI